jgi:hypothetical protein
MLQIDAGNARGSCERLCQSTKKGSTGTCDTSAVVIWLGGLLPALILLRICGGRLLACLVVLPGEFAVAPLNAAAGGDRLSQEEVVVAAGGNVSAWRSCGGGRRRVVSAGGDDDGGRRQSLCRRRVMLMAGDNRSAGEG